MGPGLGILGSFEIAAVAAPPSVDTPSSSQFRPFPASFCLGAWVGVGGSVLCGTVWHTLAPGWADLGGAGLGAQFLPFSGLLEGCAYAPTGATCERVSPPQGCVAVFAVAFVIRQTGRRWHKAAGTSTVLDMFLQ